jgi:SAM-dependent methyltransferase
MLGFARANRVKAEDYVLGDGRRLPFADGAFDYCISIAALCFISDERAALDEMARVCRRGLALGLLNRWSLLYVQKGRRGGRGSYGEARWHTPPQARALLAPLPMSIRHVRTAIYLPSGGALARKVETEFPQLPFGSFIAAVAKRPTRPTF